MKTKRDKIIGNTFIKTFLNDCSLVWMFNGKIPDKICNIKRTFSFLCKKYDESYEELIRDKKHTFL